MIYYAFQAFVRMWTVGSRLLRGTPVIIALPMSRKVSEDEKPRDTRFRDVLTTPRTMRIRRTPYGK